MMPATSRLRMKPRHSAPPVLAPLPRGPVHFANLPVGATFILKEDVETGPSAINLWRKEENLRATEIETGHVVEIEITTEVIRIIVDRR